MSGSVFSNLDDNTNLSESGGQLWKDAGGGVESLNHAPIDNTMRFMDNHGEAVTKTFMAAALMYALGGSMFGGEGAGAGGGEVANSGMDFGGNGVGYNGEVANSGMDFGGEGVGWSQNEQGGVTPTQSSATPKQPYNWQNQAQQGSNMMNQQQRQPTGNPLLNALLNQRYATTQFVPVGPGSLTPFMRS